MLGQRLRRWHNIKSVLVDCILHRVRAFFYKALFTTHPHSQWSVKSVHLLSTTRLDFRRNASVALKESLNAVDSKNQVRIPCLPVSRRFTLDVHLTQFSMYINKSDRKHDRFNQSCNAVFVIVVVSNTTDTRR